MSINFSVNGFYYTVDKNTPRETTLNEYVRRALALTGTKFMCRQGGCGACIVAVRYRNRTFSVNSCMVLVFSCDGWEVTTVEGVGGSKEGYSEVQRRFAAFNASQCGYCTPGWVMQMTSLQDKSLSMAELEKSFGSNTCRCTGYRPIMDVVKSFGTDASPTLCSRVLDIEELPKCRKLSIASKISEDSQWSLISATKDCFISTEKIEIDFGREKYFKVYTEDDIFEVLDKNGYDSYMLVDGNTAKGLLENFEYPRIIIDIRDMKSLKDYYFDQNLVLGANISLQECIRIFKEITKKDSDFFYLDEFVKHFEVVAHISVREIGSLAGNLMAKRKMPSYPSDIFLLLAGISAMVTVRDKRNNKRCLSMKEFLKVDMKGKLLLNIELPPLSDCNVFRSFKVMPRNQNALAIVNAAFRVKFDRYRKYVEDINIVYGNISPEFVNAEKTERYLKGKMLFDNKILQIAILILSGEINPSYYPEEPSAASRKKLAIGLFYKFILNICPYNLISSRYRSGGKEIERGLSSGHQEFQSDACLYPLNKPMPKLDAILQAAGEAKYTNDLPKIQKEVYASFVLSTVHSGEVDEICASSALGTEGILAVLTAKDIPGINNFMYPGFSFEEVEKEEILASCTIKFHGQPIAIVVAETEDLAKKTAKELKVTYKNTSTNPPILTIDEARKDSSRFIKGDSGIKPKRRGNNTKKVIKGVFEMGSQYHYYLELLSCIVVPVDDKLEVYDTTQWPDLTQIGIARSLNMKESDITIKVRRLGGGFGGKISRNVQVATACALVAKKFNLPCRFALPFQTNMSFTGKRPPCQCEYEVGVDNNGLIQYLEATVIQDQGSSPNERISLMKLVEGFSSCYNTDNFKVTTGLVITDKPSNTFVRAPGNIQGTSCIEHIMQHIAFAVERDPTELEGAFVQGVGYHTCEKIKHDKLTGKLLTNDFLSYHVPLCTDIPVEMNIRLKYNSCNPKGVLGAKAVGEMGMCLTHSITHVLRQCIMESRKESGYDKKEWIKIDVPYDTETLLTALDVKLGELII